MRLIKTKNMQLGANPSLSNRSRGGTSGKVYGVMQNGPLNSKPLSVLFVGLILVSSVQAQFIVTPMEVQIDDLRPGAQVTQVLTLENRNKVESQLVRMDVVELFQNKEGNWMPVGPNELADASNEVNLATHASCSEWINLSQTTLQVPAYDKVSIPFTIRPTGYMRGFYCAGIRASLPPRPGQGGVSVRYDFVVPVLITMSGPTLRSEVELVDAGLSFVESTPERRATTLVTLGIKNSGSTYAKLDSSVGVWQILESGKTRLLKRDVSMPKRPIIPGGDLTLSADLETMLPTGTYKIVGSLSVDGRQVKRLEKLVDFVNPTGKGIVHADAAMSVDPPILEMEMQPGRLRSGMLSLFNGSQEDIVVKAVAEVPKELVQRVAYGGTVFGEYLSCADWIEIRPTEIAVRSERARNVRLVIQMPDADKLTRLNVEPSHYYATIKFYGFFRDGSSAGVQTTLVTIRNEKVLPEYIVGKGNLKIESLGDSRFSMAGSFRNLSLAHIKPKCTGNISAQSVQGIKTSLIQSEPLENINAPELMMPLEERTFSKEFDFSNMPPGIYSIEARLSFDHLDSEGGVQNESVAIQKQFQVYLRPGEDERRVQIIGNTAIPGANMGG